jgi:AcrR family transcriptional regulator
MTTAAEQRPRRADAVRNRERILDAAGQAFATGGPEVPLDEIARRAGVSQATLFRHFAGRDELVAAVVDRRFVDQVEPVIEAAVAADDPWAGLCAVIEATVRLGPNSRAWHDTMVMAKQHELVSNDARRRFLGVAGALLERAQRAGTARTDIGVDDLGPIVRMLRALLVTEATTSGDSWRRYLTLLLRAPEPA